MFDKRTILFQVFLAALIPTASGALRAQVSADVGKEIASHKCVDCHSLMRVTQAHHTSEEWRHVVATMVGRGARVTPQETPDLLAYLSQLKGAAVPREMASTTDAVAQGSPQDFEKNIKRGVITGRVTVDEGEVRGFRVTAHNLRYRIWYVVFTRNGTYTIPAALPGPYRIAVLQEGYRSAIVHADLNADEKKSVDLSAQKEPLDAQVTYVDYDELYPPGPGRNLLEKTCMECHGGDFFNKQSRTEAGWRAGLNVMTYGPSFHDAPVLGHTQLSSSDKNLIVHYLSQTFPADASPRELKHDPYLVDEEALSKAIFVEYDAPEMPSPKGTEQIMDDAAVVMMTSNVQILHDSMPAPDGHVWYTASVASEIVRLDPTELNPALRWKQFPIDSPDAPRGVYPHGIAMNNEGHIFWAESQGGKVGELDPATGKTTRYTLPSEGSLLQVVRDHRNNIWYGQIQGSSLGRISGADRQIAQWGTPTADSSPYGLIVDQKDNLWTASFAKGLVIKFDPEKEVFTEYTPPTPFGGVRRLGMDSKGTIWFSEYRLNQIGSLNPDTGEMHEYKPPMRYTHCYETWPDHNDNIWVSDHFNDSLIRFEPSSQHFTYFPLPQLKWSVPKIEVESNNTIWFGSRGVPHTVAVHFYPTGYSASAPPEP